MKPMIFALLTAVAWGVGGYFEKRGLHMGNLPPQLGITIRTAVKGAPLSRVMPIAFTSPLFGAALAMAIGGEPLTTKTILGMLMTVGGIVLLTI